MKGSITIQKFKAISTDIGYDRQSDGAGVASNILQRFFLQHVNVGTVTVMDESLMAFTGKDPEDPATPQLWI